VKIKGGDNAKRQEKCPGHQSATLIRREKQTHTKTAVDRSLLSGFRFKTAVFFAAVIGVGSFRSPGNGENRAPGTAVGEVKLASAFFLEIPVGDEFGHRLPPIQVWKKKRKNRNIIQAMNKKRKGENQARGMRSFVSRVP
jgi:hypothetical protein